MTNTKPEKCVIKEGLTRRDMLAAPVALGAVGAYKGLTHFTRAGGVLTVYTLGD